MEVYPPQKKNDWVYTNTPWADNKVFSIYHKQLQCSLIMRDFHWLIIVKKEKIGSQSSTINWQKKGGRGLSFSAKKTSLQFFQRCLCCQKTVNKLLLKGCLEKSISFSQRCGKKRGNLFPEYCEFSGDSNLYNVPGWIIQNAGEGQGERFSRLF